MIFGTGGHAKVIASLVRHRYEKVDLLSETEETPLSQADFYARLDEFRDTVDVYIGVGANDARRRIFVELMAAGVSPANCIADTAYVDEAASIGRGVVICPGAVVMTGAVIGDNVIVNTLSSVDHDCLVGNHTQITAGVTFGGTTSVGESCFFGVKSATVPGVTIGDNTIVMAASLVAKAVPPDVMVGGVPARVVRSLNG
jgi:UDP-perosamine 4-acetyltransferase